MTCPLTFFLFHVCCQWWLNKYSGNINSCYLTPPGSCLIVSCMSATIFALVAVFFFSRVWSVTLKEMSADITSSQLPVGNLTAPLLKYTGQPARSLCTQTSWHTHTHVCTCTHVHITKTHTDTHTHTHTHTHTLVHARTRAPRHSKLSACMLNRPSCSYHRYHRCLSEVPASRMLFTGHCCFIANRR